MARKAFNPSRSSLDKGRVRVVNYRCCKGHTSQMVVKQGVRPEVVIECLHPDCSEFANQMAR